MDTTELELELLELESQYEKTRSKITKAELADKITLKKKEIREAKEEVKEKRVVPTKNASSRLDHKEARSKSIIDISDNSFKLNL